MANEVRVLVKADTKNAQQDIEKFGNSLGGGLASAAKIGAMAVAGIGVAAAGGLAVSINAAANFEHAIDQVGAVANATNEEMKGLSDTALRIGKDTMFSATEAAGAMEMLAANGVSVADIMNGAADAAVALAAAGGTDLATAADTASTAMAVWSLEAADMADVVNRLAGAANVSRFGVEDMSMAIAMGGGAARVSGVEFGDFASAIAAIAPNFSSGSDAGTSFKQFLAGLTPETKKAQKAFEELGLTAEDGSNKFFDANGNLKSMAEITGLLNEATRDLSEEQKSMALTTIFGSDAMRAAAGIAGLTKEEFIALDATMGNTDAADVAAQRMGNFKGSMEALKGSIETIQIEIGSKLLPKLTELADFAAENLPGAFKWLEEKLGPIAEEAVGKFVAAFDRFQDVVKDLSQNKVAVAGALGAIAGAWTLVAIAAGAAAAAQLVAIAPFALTVLAIGGVVAALTALGTDWKAVWETIVTFSKEQFAKFKGYYETDLKPVLENFEAAAKYVADRFTEHWGKIEPVVKGVADLVKIHIENIGNALQIIIDLLGGDWRGAWENTKELVKGVWDFIATAHETAFAVLRAAGAILWDIGTDLMNAFFGGVKSAFDSGIGAVTDKLDPRNWDIPGLSPMPDAMEHAGQIGAKRFVGGLAGMIAADLPAAIAAATTVDWNRIYEDADVAALYNDVPDYVKRLSPAAGGDKSNAGPYHAAGPNGTVWDDAAGAYVYPWEVGSNLPQRIFDWQNSPGFGQTGQRGQPIHITLNVDGRVLAEVVTNEMARAM